MGVHRCPNCGAFNRVGAGAGTPVCGRCKKSLDTSGAPQDVDAAGVARAIAASPVPLLVDFWAPWCGPCKVAAPIFDQVARKLAGEVVVLKVDTEANPDAAAQHQIRAIPTAILFTGGREKERRMGVQPAPALEAWLHGVIAAPASPPGGAASGLGQRPG
ncbi:MAG TPA: thioredoxin [Myxococcaceae bacterium]|nr:thioredoxin [Myxococcaceae bacterium]